MLSSRDLRALGYKKYALCELSNGRPLVTTCRKRRARDREKPGLSTDGENRRCSLWIGFEFCQRMLARLIADTNRPYGPAKDRSAVRQEKTERREENENGGATNTTKAVTTNLLYAPSPALISLELSLESSSIVCFTPFHI